MKPFDTPKQRSKSPSGSNPNPQRQKINLANHRPAPHRQAKPNQTNRTKRPERF
jgi:hypothetical protein